MFLTAKIFPSDSNDFFRGKNEKKLLLPLLQQKLTGKYL
jgi:hypothetical protein